MQLVNNFLFDTPEHLRPNLRISPFRSSDLEKMHLSTHVIKAVEI